MLSGSNWSANVSVDGFAAGPDTDTEASFNQIGPAFFRTLGIPMIAGREFSSSDSVNSHNVAIVSEAFKRKFSPNEEIVGKYMQIGSGAKNDTEIVGVARDSKYSDVKRAAPPVFFSPYRQDKQLASVSLYVLARGLPPGELASPIKKTVAGLDPDLPIERMRTFEAQVEDNIFLDRMITSMATAFAALATFLAAVGLYGVLAYSVARRTREIGIRLAIGADPKSVRRMLLKEVGILALIGVAIGAPAAIALAKFAEPLLYGLKSYDPVVIIAATVLILAVALVSGYAPARLAMNVEPLAALRHE